MMKCKNINTAMGCAQNLKAFENPDRVYIPQGYKSV
jgi:hypothetical protein